MALHHLQTAIQQRCFTLEIGIGTAPTQMGCAPTDSTTISHKVIVANHWSYFIIELEGSRSSFAFVRVDKQHRRRGVRVQRNGGAQGDIGRGGRSVLRHLSASR